MIPILLRIMEYKIPASFANSLDKMMTSKGIGGTSFNGLKSEERVSMMSRTMMGPEQTITDFMRSDARFELHDTNSFFIG